MKIEELDIQVEDISDFNDEASELLTSFCEDLEKRGMTEEIEEDDKWWAEEEGISYLWSPEARKLIEQELNKQQ